MNTPDDEYLLDHARRGDKEAVSTLLERHGPAVRRIVAPLIPRRWRALLSADDVMQETYKDAFLDVTGFEPQRPDAFTAWLLKAAKRNLLDAIRSLEASKRRKQPGGIERLMQVCGTPSHELAKEEAVARLRQAIEQLPETYRNVVEWYDLEGRPVRDVAAALKRSQGAVFMLLQRAHRWLRDWMGTGSLFLSGKH